MNIPPEKIFKAYDIRGIYPSEINEENVVAIAHALVKFFSKDKDLSSPLKIGVGRDMRISSPSLHEVIVKTFIEDGVEVIDFGIVSTPTLYFAARKYNCDGGIQISASHNPKDYNGIKIVQNGTKGILKIGKTTGMDQIRDFALKNESAESSRKGRVTEIDTKEILQEEVDNALKIAGNPTVKRFKIVADAANAMGAVYLDALFERVPADLVRMNFELDGNFPAHQADPQQPENLADIQKRVVEEKADIGIAPDGDGDRTFYIDENGQIVTPSVITSLIAREFLKQMSGQKFIVDIKSILTPKAIIEEYGGELVVQKTGHAFITEKMHEIDAVFAGENSGHYFFRDTGYAESQLPVILIVLKIMTESGKKLSELAKEIKKYEESGEINFRVKNAHELIQILKDKYSAGEISTLDGVAVTFPDWRFSLRTSNTEPLLRLNMEELPKKDGQSRKDEIIGLINQYAIFDEGEPSHG